MPTRLLDTTKFTAEEFWNLSQVSDDERSKVIDRASTDKYTKDDVLRIEPMTLFEEFTAVMIFLFGVPGSVFSVPILFGTIAYLTKQYIVVLTIAGLVYVTLFLLPAPFQEKSLSSWYALQIVRYFSFKGIFEEKLKKDKPYILVAPPHGVFPFGNIVTMIAFPSLMGFSFRGLAATAALTVPFFKQFLGTVGATDASRSNALRLLKKNITLGISTGGVAEVFDTDLSEDGDETGAALVPCYLLGNTHLLSLWCGGKDNSPGNKFLRFISRKIGFALILFWGRFFLPIPYRVPIIGLMGKPIEVPIKENPTDEEIDQYHKILIDAMIKLFNDNKAIYGWEKKQLIIK